jgi:hypothetical protein
MEAAQAARLQCQGAPGNGRGLHIFTKSEMGMEGGSGGEIMGGQTGRTSSRMFSRSPLRLPPQFLGTVGGTMASIRPPPSLIKREKPQSLTFLTS